MALELEDLTDEEAENIARAFITKRKQELWDLFTEKEYAKSACLAASMLQEYYGLDAVHVAGLSLTCLGQHDEGFEWMVAALTLSKAKSDWYANSGIASMEQKDYLRAMLFIENGIKEFPEDIRLSYMRGLCMTHSQCFENAIEYFNKTLELDPNFYHAVMSKGFCHHMLGQYSTAIELYLSIYDVAEPKDREEVVNNHVCVLMELGQQQDALALLNREYGQSDRPGTLYNKSFLYLGMGRWPEAWHLYRNRSTVNLSAVDQAMPPIGEATAHSLEEVTGKKLFLFHEQGYGDDLMFVRYAQLLQPIVSELIIGVPAPIKRLVETLDLPERFTVIADTTQEDVNPTFTSCDVSVPMLDCPALFDTTMETIPASIPYFKIPQDIIDQHRLPKTSKLRVGLVWAGSSRRENMRAHAIDRRRSIPFEMLEPILLHSDKFEFISLQMPDRRVEDTRLLQPLQEDFDMLDTAGVVMQLDLIITIDSALCHLSGALGKPVWMMSRWDGCWRWHWPAETDYLYKNTPWYPSMRLFRQKAHHTWPAVIDQVVIDLLKLDQKVLDFPEIIMAE